MATALPRYVDETVTTTVTKVDGVVLVLTDEEADALMQVLDRVLGEAPARIACDRVYVELYRLGYRARDDDPGTHGFIRFMLNEEAKL